MKAIIMAAGMSTRTHPLTLTRPKPLLKVANQSILERQLVSLTGIVDEVVIVVGFRQDMIREAFGAAFREIRITYVEQTEQLGTGHAVLQCESHITEPFLVLNGDDLYDEKDLRKLAGVANAALVKEVPDPRLYGVYEVDGQDRVRNLVEKPAEPLSNLANVGAYCFTPDVLDRLRRTPMSERGEIEITSAIQDMAEHGGFRVVRAEGYWLPIGYPWHLLDANEYFLKTSLEHDIAGNVSPLAELTGVVRVGKGSRIHAGAVIQGPVLIGEDCEVGPNCFIRGATTLGNNCKVGNACEVKNSLLMDGAHVPHLSYVGDSVIGERSNLGAGTITANLRHDDKNVRSTVKGLVVDTGRRKLGAIIGDNVHTGIHTSILPGRKLWPQTWTLPGQIVKRDIER